MNQLRQHLYGGQHTNPHPPSEEQIYQDFARAQGEDPNNWGTFWEHQTHPNEHERGRDYGRNYTVMPSGHPERDFAAATNPEQRDYWGPDGEREYARHRRITMPFRAEDYTPEHPHFTEIEHGDEVEPKFGPGGVSGYAANRNQAAAPEMGRIRPDEIYHDRTKAWGNEPEYGRDTYTDGHGTYEVEPREDQLPIFDRRRKGQRKTAWMGWGPSVAPRTRIVAGWDWDPYLAAYTADRPGRFACSCGTELDMPGHRECRCGKLWNGYVIGTGGNNHQAAAEQYLVREIPVRPDVIVARRTAAAPGHPLTHPSKPGCHHCWGDSAEQGGSDAPYLDLLKQNHHEELVHEFSKDRFLDQQKQKPSTHRGPGRHQTPRAADRHAAGDHEAVEGEEEWPSNAPPKKVKTPATPDDWHQRNPQGKWTAHNPGPRRKKKQPV